MPDALLHPARQLVDRALGIILQSDEAQLLERDLAALGGRHAAHPQAELDVGRDVEPGHQRMLLEDDAAVGAGTDDRAAVELDRAVGRREEAGNAIEQRRLAAARRADGDDEFAVLDRQVDVRQCVDEAALRSIANAEVANGECRHGRLMIKTAAPECRTPPQDPTHPAVILSAIRAWRYPRIRYAPHAASRDADAADADDRFTSIALVTHSVVTDLE